MGIIIELCVCTNKHAVITLAANIFSIFVHLPIDARHWLCLRDVVVSFSWEITRSRFGHHLRTAVNDTLIDWLNTTQRRRHHCGPWEVVSGRHTAREIDVHFGNGVIRGLVLHVKLCEIFKQHLEKKTMFQI